MCYRIKWGFQWIAYLHAFSRVIHKRGSRHDPQMDPNMSPESSNMRVLQFFLRNAASHATNPTVSSVSCSIYGKTRVKYTTGTMASCVYTVFLCISSKSADFTSVLPYKMAFTRNCIFSRVLPVKSQHGCQNRPQNGPPNRTRIALNTRFVEIIRVWVHKNTVFYRVNSIKISKKSPIEKDVDFMTIYPRKHG